MRERVCVRVWVECYPRVRKKKRVLQRNERKAEVKKNSLQAVSKAVIKAHLLLLAFWTGSGVVGGKYAGMDAAAAEESAHLAGGDPALAQDGLGHDRSADSIDNRPSSELLLESLADMLLSADVSAQS